MAKTKNSEVMVQNGKVIPLPILLLIEQLTEWLMSNKPKDTEQRDLIISESLDTMMDRADAVHDGDLQAALKAVIVAAVDAIAELNDDDDGTLTFKEASESGANILEALNECRAISTTLLLHAYAQDVVHVEIPDDLRINAKGEIYSASFEDAE